jgi:hypothetical protein
MIRRQFSVFRPKQEFSMKKIFLFFSLLFLLALAACSTAAEANPDDATGGTTNADSDLTTMQLALGTFALEDTGYAITAEQAAELLPLWKAAQSLSDSETITAEEFQAVFNQIEETMTPEQMDAIESLELTQETMASISEKYGLAFGPGSGGGFDPSKLSPEQQATIEAFQESGQAPGGGGFPGGGPGGGGFPGGGVPPEGGFPGGGPGGVGFPGGGGDISSLPEAQQTAIASGTGRRFGGGLPIAFYAAVIDFLEGKVQ